MSIDIQILGSPGEDNASLLRINSGSSIDRLLFDCGAKVLDDLKVSTIQSIDHLFFSHFHMDHICGFDSFFRLNYNRPDKPVTIWGPIGTIDVIHHRLQGVTWNLHHDQPGEWIVNEVTPEKIHSARFYTSEAFGVVHRDPDRSVEDGKILEEKNFCVSAKLLCHGSIPSIAYRIEEPRRQNIDPAKLSSMDLKPGPWIREVKDCPEVDTVQIDGIPHKVSELRNALLSETPGSTAAYLTDFIISPDSTEWEDVCAWLRGVDTLICETQYRDSDIELAETHSHMTTTRVARLAVEAGVKKLIMQHVSRRYDKAVWIEMLAETQSIFPAAAFPDQWKF